MVVAPQASSAYLIRCSSPVWSFWHSIHLIPTMGKNRRLLWTKHICMHFRKVLNWICMLHHDRARHISLAYSSSLQKLTCAQCNASPCKRLLNVSLFDPGVVTEKVRHALNQPLHQQGHTVICSWDFYRAEFCKMMGCNPNLGHQMFSIGLCAAL